MRAFEYSILSRLLLGPIAADDSTGAGFLDGQAADYITPSVISPACKYAVYAGDATRE